MARYNKKATVAAPNAALASAVGIVTGMGYKIRHKGNNPMLTYAADHLVK